MDLSPGHVRVVRSSRARKGPILCALRAGLLPDRSDPCPSRVCTKRGPVVEDRHSRRDASYSGTVRYSASAGRPRRHRKPRAAQAQEGFRHAVARFYRDPSRHTRTPGPLAAARALFGLLPPAPMPPLCSSWSPWRLGGSISPHARSARYVVASSYGVSGISPSAMSARRAAFCSASFLFGPQALGNWRPPIDTATSKHLA
jgi:hypothetical protein